MHMEPPSRHISFRAEFVIPCNLLESSTGVQDRMPSSVTVNRGRPNILPQPFQPTVPRLPTAPNRHNHFLGNLEDVLHNPISKPSQHHTSSKPSPRIEVSPNNSQASGRIGSCPISEKHAFDSPHGHSKEHPTKKHRVDPCAAPCPSTPPSEHREESNSPSPPAARATCAHSNHSVEKRRRSDKLSGDLVSATCRMQSVTPLKKYPPDANPAEPNGHSGVVAPNPYDSRANPAQPNGYRNATSLQDSTRPPILLNSTAIATPPSHTLQSWTLMLPSPTAIAKAQWNAPQTQAFLKSSRKVVAAMQQPISHRRKPTKVNAMPLKVRNLRIRQAD